ncbi:PASTA domain-containing protein [Microlunatus speluncae]|uniref:PASTA domain-containing protein n=1 Tax=Microlunatus speluncae TaxID=2594267 RepID=UPI0012665B05|nr:PASTA domain-containing protein [Microlunatus speluncae]
MTTAWVIRAAAERVELVRSGTAEQPGPSTGELTFTITNSGPVEDRAVFEIVPGDGAKKPWFTVDEPQRRVPGGQSATLLIKVSVPVEEPAGPFWIQGRVYSADTAPEESSRLSGRVSGEVTAVKIDKPKPWWLLAVAALLVIVLGVVGWLVLRPREPEPVAVPGLAGLSEEEARAALAGVGLQLGTALRRHRPGADRTVIQQAVPEGAPVPPGSAVDVEIGVVLAAPQLTAPANGAQLIGPKAPTLQWAAVPDAAFYTVRREVQVCSPVQNPPCHYELGSTANVAGTTAPGTIGRARKGSSGWVRWQITALDDFKDPGPTSDYFTYRVVQKFK